MQNEIYIYENNFSSSVPIITNCPDSRRIFQYTLLSSFFYIFSNVAMVTNDLRRFSIGMRRFFDSELCNDNTNEHMQYNIIYRLYLVGSWDIDLSK